MLTAVLALLVGVLYVVLGLLRMGFIARFFAETSGSRNRPSQIAGSTGI